MKAARVLLIATGVVLALVALLVAVAFTPAFQTWAARQAIARQPDVQASVGRVQASLNRVRVENLKMTHEGATLTLPSLDAELSLLQAAREDVHIRRLVAKGWILDLRAVDPARLAALLRTKEEPAPRRRDFSFLSVAYAQAAPGPAVSSAVFQGVLAQLRLPVDLSIDAAELEGEVIFPTGAGHPPGRAKVTLTGGNMGVGREGRFDFTAAALAADSPVAAIDATGSLHARMDSPRTFSRIASNADAEARGAQFPEGARLTTTLVAERAGQAENYTLTLQNGTRKLVDLQAQFPADATRIDGMWAVDASDADFAPFALGHSLPAFAAKGSGSFDTDTSFRAFGASGRLAGHADKLERLQPRLAGVGAVTLLADFDAAKRAGGFIHLEKLTLRVAGADPLLTVEALQSFEFNPRTSELRVADPARDLVSVEAQDLPLSWAQPWLDEVVFSSGQLRGSFVVAARGGGFAVRTAEPLTVTKLSVVREGKLMLESVDVAVTLSADSTPQGWQAEISDLAVRSGTSSLLAASARAGRLVGADEPIKAAGQWGANLPAVLAQPAATEWAVLTRGRASGSFAANLGARKEIQATLALNDLAVEPQISTETFPSLSLEVRADVEADGRIALNVPLTLEREGRTSDLTLSGLLSRQSDRLLLDAKVLSNELIVEDAQVLLLPLSREKTTPDGQPIERDTEPFWSGVEGQVSVAFKRVVYQDEFVVTNVGGTLRLDAGSLRLETVRAGLSEGGELQLDGNVSFSQRAPEPYALKADLVIDNFNPAPLFLALDPKMPPTVDGVFQVRSQMTGRGGNSVQLIERTQGEFQFSSKRGVFRALRADVTEAIKEAPSKISGFVSGLGSLLGKEGAEKLGNDINRRGKIIADIAGALAEIAYDQLNVAVARDAALNVRLYDFTLIAPEVRLTGTGEVRHVEGVPLLAQPLDFRLQLGARGGLAELMNRANLLDGRQDNLGYTGFATPLQITGSLEKPDTTALTSALVKAATGSLLNNLLGR